MSSFPDLFAKFDHKGRGYFDVVRLMDDYYYTRPILPPIPDRRMEFDGRRCIMWSINNYLGLANNERIRRVALKAVERYGLGAPMGSRMMTGNTHCHHRLERELAAFSQKESAYLFNYGYLGVIGTITSLADKGDTVIIDKLAHACIVDAAMQTSATMRVFKHNDMDDLESVLKAVNRKRTGGLLIATEGVFGMTGDLAHLRDICALAQRYEARVFVDDAHGWGVMGTQGRGVADYLGVQEQVDIYFGTFAKAFASIGGFSACAQPVRDWISYNARSQVFAKSLPIVYVEALIETLELVKSGDQRRTAMWRNSKRLKDGLRDAGYYVGSGASPICSVFAGIPDSNIVEQGMRLTKWFRKQGIFVTVVIYPVIPQGLGMFRMIPTVLHNDEDIDMTVAAFRRLREENDIHVDLSAEENARLNTLFGRSA